MYTMNTFKTKKYTQRGSATGDLVLVASIVLVLGVLWILTGGSDQGTEQRNVFSTNSVFIPIERDPTDTRRDVDQEYERIAEEYGRTRDFGETSPYWGLVTIEEFSNGPQQTTPQDEYVILKASSNLDESLTLTGWALQSMISNEVVTLPKATKISTSGNINIEQPIMISPEDIVYVRTGHSPVGHSFQVNTCSGYFEQFQDFTPPLSKQCPSPKNELKFAQSDPFRFGDACLTYIENLSRCSMPLEALPIGFSDSCTIFITEEINYASCVKNHRDDSNFFKPEWRVYLKRNEEIWSTRDIIRLLDSNGKTVDVFSY